MKKLISTFVKYPFYANLIIAVLLVAGLLSIAGMKKSFFPESTPRMIFVSISYPGASPKEMEESCVIRIEEAIRSIVGIKDVRSTASENRATINIVTTGKYDIDETLANVKNAVDGISSFPVEAEKPVVFKQLPETFAGFISLHGNVDLYTLKKYADIIEKDFLTSGVMSRVKVTGFPNLEISVEVSEENLLRYNLTFENIARVISMNNRDISAGQIKSNEYEIIIRSRTRTIDPNKIGDIILRAEANGSLIRVRDVAEVKLQFADIPGEMFMNGKQAVSFNITKLPEEDLDAISSFIKNYSEKFNNNHTDVTLEITYDFLEMLGKRLALLYKNGFVGIFLVIVALGLFLNFRLSLWVAWGIPASFFAMFVVGNLYGITINMISLFGMILVIGILVDDGIVIAENIYSHFEKGKSPKQAAIDGTMEVVPAVITSVLTTIIAFSPLFFIDGHMEFMFEMAFVVIFSLFFSLFEAFFVLPAHLSHRGVFKLEKRKNQSAKIRKYLDGFIDYLRYKLYGYVLKTVIKWRIVVVFIPIALIIITVGLFKGGFINLTFFPSIPFDQFSVEVAFKPGTGTKITDKYLNEFEDIIWEVNNELKQELNDTNDLINYTFLSVGAAYNGLEVGGHAGSITVLLRDLENSGTSSYEISSRVKEKIGDVPEAEKITVSGRDPFGDKLSITLLGEDLKELTEAKEYLKREMLKLPEIAGVNDNNAVGKQEIQLKLKDKAYFLGLDHLTISNQVRQGFFGGLSQRLQRGKDELWVWVRYPKADRVSLGQLENMKIKTGFGEYPLSELAYFTVERGPVNIIRYNSSREATVKAELVDQNIPIMPISTLIKKNIVSKVLELYPSVKVDYQGQEKETKEAGTQMMKYFGIAFILIVVVLVVHFMSVFQAIIVLMMIPIAWVGVSWGHGIEGIPLSMLSAWGMVALSGVIINDAVVFLQKYNTNLIDGQSVREAIYHAGISRFRPILLTTITTVLGLYPLILETSFQAQFLRPMAVSLAYGVFIGTGFILVFFPALILIINDIVYGYKWLYTGEKPVREDLTTAIMNSKKTIN